MRNFFGMWVVLFMVAGTVYARVPQERSFEFDYEVTLKDIPRGATKLNLWIPVLPQTAHQIVDDISVDSLNAWQFTRDKVYDNKMLNIVLTKPFDKQYKVIVKYKLKRLEFLKRENQEARIPMDSREDLAKFLKDNRLVVLTPEIRQMAQEIVEGKTTTIEKARAIYDHVLTNVAYNKVVPGWGQGDVERVCSLKAGNCTDFHSLFIALSRAVNIPAKFVIGIPLKEDKIGKVSGYHCWAEFYEERLGWVPVDISEAWKDKSKVEYYFGAIGASRLEFTRGRDIVLEPNQSGDPLNYFVYPYAEVDGKVHKGVGVLFKYRERESILY